MSKLNGTMTVNLTMAYDLPVEKVELALAGKNPGKELVELVKLSIPTDPYLYDFQLASIHTALGKYFVEKRVAELRQLPEHSTVDVAALNEAAESEQP